jgi:hypothetical protein
VNIFNEHKSSPFPLARTAQGEVAITSRGEGRFNFGSFKKALFVLAILLTAGCQDHHFLPIEKADHIKMPGSDSAGNKKSFEDAGPGEKEVMSDAYGEKVYQKPKSFEDTGSRTLSQVMTGKNRLPAASGLIASGKLVLEPAMEKRDFSGFTVYIIARRADQPGPPLAVSRITEPDFPLEFRLDEKNMMIPGFPSSGETLIIEARLDADGDPITKEPGDVYGFSAGPVKAGSDSVSVVMNKTR